MNNRDWNIKYSDAVQQQDGSWLLDDGTIYWYNDKGQPHRENGPAIVYVNDSTSIIIGWYLLGRPHTFNQWCTEVNITDEQKLLLMLQYE
jgi:hypothetical protein